VERARSRQETDTFFTQYSYVVLITDLRLTGSDVDGRDIARLAHKQHLSIHSILLTAYGRPEIEKLAHEQGVSVCLSKKVDGRACGDSIEARQLETTARFHARR
jgi:DNA-binding NarL/FixJ family response regulator